MSVGSRSALARQIRAYRQTFPLRPAPLLADNEMMDVI
jgi:hypothetical protein